MWFKFEYEDFKKTEFRPLTLVTDEAKELRETGKVWMYKDMLLTFSFYEGEPAYKVTTRAGELVYIIRCEPAEEPVIKIRADHYLDPDYYKATAERALNIVAETFIR